MTNPIIARGRRVAPKHADVVTGFNNRIAVTIGRTIGTMWTAYLFVVLALLSLPAILVQGGFVSPGTFPSWLVSVGLIALVGWIAQTFLQLVLLPVILVGQNLSAKFGDARSEAVATGLAEVKVTQSMIKADVALMHDMMSSVLVEVSLLRAAVAKPKASPRPRAVKPPPAP